MSSPITHRVEVNTKIGAACASEATRYAMTNVLVAPVPGCERDIPRSVSADGKDTPTQSGRAWLAATDGRLIACVPTDADCTGATLLPASIIPKKAAKSGPFLRRKIATLNGKWENTDGKFCEPTTGRLPNMADYVPSANPSCGEICAVTIDAKLLANLAAAINVDGSGVLTLFISLEKKLKERDYDAAMQRQIDGPPLSQEEKDEIWQYDTRPANRSAIRVLGGDGIGAIMPLGLGDSVVGWGECGKKIRQFDSLQKEMASAVEPATKQIDAAYYAEIKRIDDSRRAA